MRKGWSRFFGGSARCWFCPFSLSRKWMQSVWQEICPTCRRRFSRIEKIGCKQCGRPLQAAVFHRCEDCCSVKTPVINRSVVTYSESVKEIIWQLKYRGLERLAEPLGRMMAEQAIACYGKRKYVVTCVPLSEQRLRLRGFNQAERLARIVSRELGLPYIELLKRRHTARTQSQMGRQERLQSLRGVFSLRVSNIKSKWLSYPVLLIDDVYTTGTTLRECAKPLLQAGIREVHTLTFARA
jgi:competence protein ComFC